MGELRGTFRPEFLNRVDDIIVFKRLTKDEIREIAKRLLEDLRKRTASLDVQIKLPMQVSTRSTAHVP